VVISVSCDSGMESLSVCVLGRDSKPSVAVVSPAGPGPFAGGRAGSRAGSSTGTAGTVAVAGSSGGDNSIESGIISCCCC